LNKIYKIFTLIILLFSATVETVISSDNITFSKVQNLSNLNSSFNEFAPYLNYENSTLYFCSDSNGISKIYSAKMKPDRSFENPQLFNSNFNKNNKNKSYLTFINNEHAYLNYYRLYKDRSYLNIYQSFFRKKSWTDPVPVEELKSYSFSGQQTIAPDGSFIIFSSDRDNRYDSDLYIAYKKADGTWDNIMSLSKLNSTGNEITPFLVSKDTLIFATNGYEGQGGYDLYCSVFQSGEWTRPFPLDGLNTEFDESDCIILKNNTVIFSSNRPGGLGNSDLYTADLQRSESSTKNDYREFSASLNSSVSLIKVNSINHYNTAMLFPAANYSDSSFIINTILNSGVTENFSIPNDKQFRALSVYKFLDRFSKLNASANLTVYHSDKLNRENSKFLAHLFYTIYKFDSLQVKYVESNLDSSEFYLYCDNPDIYEPFQVNKTEFDIQPQNLDLELVTRPENYTMRYKYYLNCDISPTENLELKQFENKNFININLKNWYSTIANSSILTVCAKGIDSNLNSFEKKIEFNISSNSSSEKLFLNRNDKTFEIVILPYDFNNKILSDSRNQIINYIRGIYRPNKEIIVISATESNISEFKSMFTFAEKKNLIVKAFKDSGLDSLLIQDNKLNYILVEK
jgi:hypothetical protein